MFGFCGAQPKIDFSFPTPKLGFRFQTDHFRSICYHFWGVALCYVDFHVEVVKSKNGSVCVACTCRFVSEHMTLNFTHMQVIFEALGRTVTAHVLFFCSTVGHCKTRLGRGHGVGGGGTGGDG